MKNSFKICKAIMQNNDKFDEIREISEEINAVIKRKNDKEEQFRKVYEIIFKGICSKKVEITKVVGDATYYICPTGISVKKWKYGTNASSISSRYENLTQELLIVNKFYDEFYSKIPSKDKRIIFKKFMKNIGLLKKKEMPSIHINKKVYFPRRFVDERGMLRLRKTVSMTINFGDYGDKIKIATEKDEKDGWLASSINPSNPSIGEAVIIEQLFVEIRKGLQTTLKKHKKELANMEKYLNYLDLKFSSYIKSIETLNELRKN